MLEQAGDVFGPLYPPWLGQCALSETNVSTTAQNCACMNNPARTALASPSVSASAAQLICQLNKLSVDNQALAVHRRK